MAGRKRRHHLKARRLQTVVALEITALLSTTDRGLQVRLKATGKTAWLPRAQTQLCPGLAVVPEWLAARVCPADEDIEKAKEGHHACG